MSNFRFVWFDAVRTELKGVKSGTEGGDIPFAGAIHAITLTICIDGLKEQSDWDLEI
jgi:hypothetical protein